MPGPLILTNSTTLELTPLSGLMTPVLTPWSARGVTATLEPIGSDNKWLRRDVNGFLRDFSDERFRKYKLSVSCRDGEAPCLDGTWQGAIVQVSSPVELSYPVGGTPQRAEVSGSTRTQGNYVYYRPDLTMMVRSIRDVGQEYSAMHSWDLVLEEV